MRNALSVCNRKIGFCFGFEKFFLAPYKNKWVQKAQTAIATAAATATTATAQLLRRYSTMSAVLNNTQNLTTSPEKCNQFREQYTSEKSRIHCQMTRLPRLFSGFLFGYTYNIYIILFFFFRQKFSVLRFICVDVSICMRIMSKLQCGRSISLWTFMCILSLE